MLFASILIFCTFVDIDTMSLPDFATVGGALLGVAASALFPDIHGARIEGAPFFASSVASLVSSVCGLAVGSGILYWMRLGGEIAFGREAMGEGDVILVGMIGAFCGWQGALFAVFGGSLIGAAAMVPLVALRSAFSKGKKSGKKPRNPLPEDASDSAPDAIPYGPWLAIGGLAYYMFLSKPVDAYFGGVAGLLFK